VSLKAQALITPSTKKNLQANSHRKFNYDTLRLSELLLTTKGLGNKGYNDVSRS